MKKIGIGESDFRMLRNNNYYLIDKSLFIKDILDDSNKVILITRPRRFGKTLNMSMLRCYLDCNEPGGKELFKGLKIMEQGEEYTSKLGTVPCIFLSLKSVKGLDYNDMLENMRQTIYRLYAEYRDLLDSDKIYEDEKETIKEILNKKASKTTIINSITDLSVYLNRVYGKRPYLLLDEYDVPIQDSYVKKYYETAIEFFKEFYVTTFKDNSYLEKTVITGVTRVAKESIFTGANNFTVYTMLDNPLSTSFGITEEEMEKAIKDYELEDKKDEIKKWYDGYTVGETKGLYNPWSLLNYLQQREIKQYWVHSSSNDVIEQVIKKSTTIKQKVEELLRDEAIEVRVKQETILRNIENNENNIWGLFLGTGYLKVEEEIDKIKQLYKVKIPNYEIKSLFEEMVIDWFEDKVIGNDLNSILKDLITLNIEEFKEKFKILVLRMISYIDVGEDKAENFYHAFVLGMLVSLKDKYYIKSNRESGMGRYDIMLEPKEKNGNSFIMEFKVYKGDKEKTLEDTIKNAKKQIEEKRYEEELRERGFTNITKMVFAFKTKDVAIDVY